MDRSTAEPSPTPGRLVPSELVPPGRNTSPNGKDCTARRRRIPREGGVNDLGLNCSDCPTTDAAAKTLIAWNVAERTLHGVACEGTGVNKHVRPINRTTYRHAAVP